jgi:CRP-like cAMP-binding protein
MPSDPHLVQLSRSLFLTAFAGNMRIEPWIVDRVAPKLDEVFAPKGTVLFRAGDAPQFVYFMESGAVSMERAGAGPVHMTGKWVVGALECGVDLVRQRTAIVLEDTRFVTAPASTWYELIEDSFEMARTAYFGTLAGLTGLYGRLTEEALEVPETPLPISLPPTDLDLVERLLVLSGRPLLTGAGMQTLTDVAASAEERRLTDASELVGSAADPRIHLLLSGTVVAKRVGRKAQVTVRAGSFIPSAVTRSRDFELTSSGPLRTLAFRPEDVLDEMEEHPDLVRAMLAALWLEREWVLERLVTPEGPLVLV